MTTPRVLAPGAPEEAQFAFNGTLEVPKYCLMFHVTDDVRPAASLADTGTEQGNQEAAAPLFAGVSLDYRSVLNTAADAEFPIGTDVLMEVDCSSATFEVGDKVTVVEQSNGTQLENQKVVKTGTEALAIGTVYKRYAAATTRVWVRFMSRVLPNSAVVPDTEDEVSSLTTPIIIMDGATGENEIRLVANLADALSIEDTNGDIIVIDTSTGANVIGLKKNTTLAGTFLQTSAAAIAFAVGRQGSTTPALAIKGDVATCVTGLLVTPRAAAAGVNINVTSSGTDENLVIDAKGSGTITLNGTATGIVIAGTKLQATAGGIQTKMATTNVNDTIPTEAEAITAFGTAAAAGSGFVGLIKDNNADVNAYLCLSTGAKWAALKFTVLS